ncbi:MAG: hypothetical protein WAO58_03680 [Fimbriimonadaceae bacterium]
MMFRRLYWVTEELAGAGSSSVTGVYTSIPDLIRHGIRWTGEPKKGFRLTLVKLDCGKEPLGTFVGPRFEGLEERLSDFIRTDEFSHDECRALTDALSEFSSVRKA